MLIKVNLPLGISYLQNPDSKYVDGIDPLWYTSVGASLTMTMIIDIIAPHAAALLTAFIAAPLGKCMARRGSAGKMCCATTYVTQQDLNNAFEPPEFELPVRMANMMATIAMTFLYAGPLPILVVFALISFIVSFTVDRYLIVNFYRKPPKYTTDIVEPIFVYFKFIIIFHMIMSLLSYSAPGVLDPSKLNSATNLQDVDSRELQDADAENLQNQYLNRPYVDGSNVVLFVLFVLYTTIYIAYTIANATIGKLLYRVKLIFRGCFSCCGCGAAWDTITHREYNPPYTDAFRKHLRNYKGHYITNEKKALKSVTKRDRKEGWIVRYDKGNKHWFKAKCVKENGKIKALKRTYEIVDDGGLYSYDINLNPRYTKFLQTKKVAKDVSHNKNRIQHAGKMRPGK